MVSVKSYFSRPIRLQPSLWAPLRNLEGSRLATFLQYRVFIKRASEHARPHLVDDFRGPVGSDRSGDLEGGVHAQPFEDRRQRPGLVVPEGLQGQHVDLLAGNASR